MAHRLSRNWWALALRGVLAIVVGIVAFLLPGPTIVALVLLFAAFAIVDGAFALVSGFRREPDGGRNWLLVLGGLAGIAAGVIAFMWPVPTAVVLGAVIAAWAIVTGMIEIVAAYRLREEVRSAWVFALEGIASVAFGLILVLVPAIGLVALAWLIGAWAIASGVLFLAFALRLRALHQRTGQPRTRAPSAA